ncbi:hypothetical protein KC902_03495 [Candidatus Kaiserbacteria bacterium]|nr:hypothetical protein [Candidatus Kaiserbacteria bacterium]USN89199.1 MAG: hypothetical protein H6780_02165 [Candidatus Nomurabacteria bacterium]
MRSVKHKTAGMTFIEMIVIISVYTVLVLVIFSSVTSLYRQNSYAMSQANEVDNARRGIMKWQQDTKEMTTGADGTYPVDVIDEHHMAFYGDTDLDNSVEYVEYILASTTLTKYIYDPVGTPPVYNLGTPSAEETLSLYVQNINQGVPTFTYFDNDGTQLSSTSPVIDVRYVKAQIIVNIDPVQSPGEFMLKSSVAPRNLKDNL